MSSASLQRAAAHRIVCAVVAGEVRRVRGADPPHAGADWPEDIPIGREGLGLDSLERLGALGALAETFGITDDELHEHPPRIVGDWTDRVLRVAARGGSQLTVHTSGSTGSPRPCRHLLSDLLGEAAFFAAGFADRRRVVALVPARHLYGIVWTALLPSLLGAPVVTRSIGVKLGIAPGDLVVAVPDQWRAMARMVGRFPDDVAGVTSAGSLSDATCTALLAAGLARLIDVYGASETSAIAMRNMPAPGYALLPRWRLLPDGDGDWRLADARGGTAQLPDHVERLGERLIRPIGRRDRAVKIGGYTVWPERVAEMLRVVNGVADAAVRLHASGRLKAFVVPDAAHDPDVVLRSLRAFFDSSLTEAERPVSIRFGPSLPRNGMGKLEDWK